MLLRSGGGFDKAVYQEMQAGDAGGPSAFDTLYSLEHSIDPARLQRGDHARDVLAVQGSGQGWQYPSSLRALPQRHCTHPGRHVR